MVSDRIVEAIHLSVAEVARQALIGGKSNAVVGDGKVRRRRSVSTGKVLRRHFNELRSGILIPQPVSFGIKGLFRGGRQILGRIARKPYAISIGGFPSGWEIVGRCCTSPAPDRMPTSLRVRDGDEPNASVLARNGAQSPPYS